MMRNVEWRFALPIVAAVLIASSGWAATAVAQEAPAEAPPALYPELPSEIPAEFVPVTDRFDHERRTVEIPMRDGVKLHTVILVPKGAEGAPILLTRTPYDADSLTGHADSAHLEPVLRGYDNASDVIVQDGYVRVVQDVRGKHGSEGDYVMNRPLRGPQNPTPVDHATDTWDTIEWLVENVPETNGRVGILGISYDGFLPLMALVDPHPALKVAVPMNPMVDGWLGDDWFHNGAFRQLMASFIYDQQATRKSETKFWRTHFDDYTMFLDAGSAGEVGRRWGLEQLGFWRKLLEHPTYDAFWRDQAVDRLLGERPLEVPAVMLVHGWWDQEDVYGALAVYRALEPKDTGNDRVFLVAGPWNHGQQIHEGSSLGAIRFGSDTALTFRQEMLRPFLAQHLIDGAPAADLAPVTAFETGTNTWRELPEWPAGCAEGCAVEPAPLYLRADGAAAFAPPAPEDEAFTEYVSDPAKPVPFLPRPVWDSSHDGGEAWRTWLVEDQRMASSRPDVAVFTSEVLDAPVKLAGRPAVNLVASTSGTDSDWVVKLVDVHPDEVAAQPEMGGYELAVSMDVFRGRYRESLEEARPLAAGEPLEYRFDLPAAHHVFLPGHRIQVQVQSSWFPLYDRNPQTFVPNIFFAEPDDYVKATQRVFHEVDRASFVELPVVREPAD
jgi:uncharacterized protein